MTDDELQFSAELEKAAREAALVKRLFASDEWKIVDREMNAVTQQYLANCGASEYAAVVAANRAQAFSDLTSRLVSVIEREAELMEVQQEAASGPKTSSGRLPPARPPPHAV